MLETMMPQSNGSARYVFVYGTLRRGGRNDIARFVPAPVYVGDATIAGTLYDLGSYPGAVLGGVGCVVGEVYGITPLLEAQLDRLEEVKPDGSGEYRKCDVSVALGSQVLRCLTYEIHPDRIIGCPVLAGGDWMASR